MDDFDDYFKTLGEINHTERELKCCEIKENYEYTNKGETICKICSNTISNIIDTPEWKNYKDSNTNTTRCGMPTNVMLPESSMGTTIKNDYNFKMSRVNRYQQWNSMPYKERSLYKVYKDIEDKCIAGDLPLVISETAQSYYLTISETKISRGSNRIGIIAACIYYACKECEVPRSTNELSSLFQIDNKIMTKGCKNFTEIMRMSKDRKRIQTHKSVNLHDFIDRFSHKLELSDKIQKHIRILSKLCEELNLVNDNTPPAMAAGCIYLYIRIVKIDIDKKQISEVCKISEVTINKCSKKLEENEIIMNKINELSKVNKS
jgi:transcription initiation factor TFIIB